MGIQRRALHRDMKSYSKIILDAGYRRAQRGVASKKMTLPLSPHQEVSPLARSTQRQGGCPLEQQALSCSPCSPSRFSGELVLTIVGSLYYGQEVYLD